MKKITAFLILLLVCGTANAAKQSGKIQIQYPPVGQATAGTLGNWTYIESARTIDAASEKVGQLMPILTSGEIHKIHFRTGTVTTGATVDVRLETHSGTTGLPTGTLVDTNSNASQVIADANDNTWFTVTLTGDATVTKNDLVWVVISNPAASFGNMSFPEANNFTTAPLSDRHFYVGLYGASWAKGADGCFQFVLEYDNGMIEPYSPNCMISAHSFTATAFNTGSTPDEYASKMNIPWPVRVTGLWAYTTKTEDAVLTLYDSDGSTSLGTCTIDKDTFLTSTGLYQRCFIAAVELTKDTNYYVSLKSASTTSINAYRLTTSTAALMDALPAGQDVFETTRTDAGAWSDSTTGRTMVGILIDQFDDGASGGGGSTDLLGVIQ